VRAIARFLRSGAKSAGVRLAIVVGIVYALATWVGLALLARPESIAILWPASGIAAGVIIVRGSRSWLPVAAGVAVATLFAHAVNGRYIWAGPAFALCNAGEVVLTAWLLERWFGPGFKLEDLPHVLGLFAAAGLAAGSAAVGAYLAMLLFGQPNAPPFTIWALWFASDALGIITVAPVMIGLAQIWRQRPEPHELTEAGIALLAVTVASATVFALTPGPWSVFVPDAVLLPLLLWLAARCQPVFAAAAVLIIALATAIETISGLGAFGDPRFPLAERVLAGQSGMLTAAVAGLVLAALFAARRQHAASLEASERRLRSILAATNVVAWEVDVTKDTEPATPPAGITSQAEGSPVADPAPAATSIHPDDRDRVLAEFQAALRGDTLGYRAEFRVLPDDGGVRWISSEGTVLRAADGQPLRMLGINHDITARRNTEEALRENEERMRVAARVANIGFWVLDLATQQVRGTPEYFGLFGLPPSDEPVPVETLRALYLPEDRARIISMMEHSIATGKPLAQDRRIKLPDGRLRWLHIVSDTRRDADGRPVARYGATFDITERKDSEEHIKLLMREVNHRAKNLLAVVHVMARHTAGDVEPKVFAARFGDRLVGLAASHDLLVKSDWKGADVADLVRSQLMHFGDVIGTRITLDGPALSLKPAAAQTVGMALHELATNAAKYGALSRTQGSIRVEWGITNEPNGTCLRLLWVERGGPAIETPIKQGFGHTVMVDMVKHALDADVRLEYQPSGAVWELVAPVKWTLGLDLSESSLPDSLGREQERLRRLIQPADLVL
jgi:PAS domain S-box-containing protein